MGRLSEEGRTARVLRELRIACRGGLVSAAANRSVQGLAMACELTPAEVERALKSMKVQKQVEGLPLGDWRITAKGLTS